jgi:signal peptidase II
MIDFFKTYKPSRLGVMALAIAAVVIVADQASKAWFLGLHLLEGESQQVAPFFKLTMVWNPGISLGLFQNHGDLGRWLLVAFGALAVIGLGIWAGQTQRLFNAIAAGLIIGGAAGNNLIDRVRLGMVCDFLDFSGIGFKWVFNLADAAIDIGIAFLILEMVLGARQPAAPPTEPKVS